MSAGFRAVQWNRDKLIYDAILAAGVVVFLGGFAAIAGRLHPPNNLADTIDIWIRATGSCAFLMLTIILCIGPLARLDRRFLPLLTNRRHLGVLTFLIAAAHGWLMVEWYAAQNALPDLVAEMTSGKGYDRFIGFPFKMLGLAALVVL
ncbi:MAG TPA: (2Fe-2S)-binding protein, partial [Xanthobacteraceae bacterium]